MAAKSIRRRTQHAGDEGKYNTEASIFDTPSEPLLGKHCHDEGYSEVFCIIENVVFLILLQFTIFYFICLLLLKILDKVP